MVEICWDSWLEHMLVGTIRMKLRVPTRPSARRNPMKVGVSPDGMYAGGGVCRSSGNVRTRGTSSDMLAWETSSPSAIPRDVPMGWPYCRTNSPAGMAFSEKRLPTLTSDTTTMLRPDNSIDVPADTAFFTTATLSRESTMMAKSLIKAMDDHAIAKPESGTGSSLGRMGLEKIAN